MFGKFSELLFHFAGAKEGREDGKKFQPPSGSLEFDQPDLCTELEIEEYYRAVCLVIRR